MSEFEIIWTSEAVTLLRKRDHYTRDAIMNEFQASLRDLLRAIPVNPEKTRFVTSVANHKYSVIWKKNNHDAIVEAVVATQFSPKQALHLTKQVQSVVQQESNGEYTLA